MGKNEAPTHATPRVDVTNAVRRERSAVQDMPLQDSILKMLRTGRCGGGSVRGRQGMTGKEHSFSSSGGVVVDSLDYGECCTTLDILKTIELYMGKG